MTAPDVLSAATALGVELVRLDDDHPLVVAAVLAVELRGLRDAHRRAMADAGHQVSAARDWRRTAAEHVTYDELRRRRTARRDGAA